MPEPTTRRRSPVPGMWTRARLLDELGLSAKELDTLERQEIVGPAEPRRPGDTRPVLYGPFEVALVRFALQAGQLGVRGRHLRSLLDELRRRRRRIVPGWSGWVVFDGAVCEIVDDESALVALLRSYHGGTAVLAATFELAEALA